MKNSGVVTHGQEESGKQGNTLLDIKSFRTNDDDDDDDNADNETNYSENRAVFCQLMHFTFDISEVKMIQDLMASHS